MKSSMSKQMEMDVDVGMEIKMEMEIDMSGGGGDMQVKIQLCPVLGQRDSLGGRQLFQSEREGGNEVGRTR